MIRNLAAGLRALWRRGDVQRELDEEVRAYLDMAVEDKVRRGMSRAEAMRAVRMESGDAEAAVGDVRAAAWESALETWWQDLCFAARQLARAPGFTLLAVLTLAVGIGGNTAIFSYINAFVINPLPYPDADRLMVFASHDTKKGWTWEGVSPASFLDFQERTASFARTVLWTDSNFNVTGDGPPVLVDGGRVSWSFFETLGARPLLGRSFTADEDAPGARHVVIVGEGLWQGRFGGDPAIVGRDMTIGGEPYRIVGVMPAGFQFPQTNTNLTLLVGSMTDDIARKEGAPELLLCLTIVALILLMACANVANLVLSRAIGRAREFAVRAALGATRGRLVRQLLTESLLLFLLAGAAGALLGLGGMRWIEAQVPDHIRGYLVNYGHVDLDLRTLAFTFAVALLCGIGFGLAPAREGSTPDLQRGLKEAARQASGSQRGARLRRVFVASQVALAMVVLTATTLLIKSFILSVRSSPGFDPEGVMVAQLALPGTKYAEEWRRREFGERVLARLRGLPDTVSVGVANAVPFGGFGASAPVEAMGKPRPPGQGVVARFTAVSADYFGAMRMGMLEGRTFGSGDGPGGAPVAIVDDTLARELWPGQDPVGRQMQFGAPGTVCTVIGVSRTVKMYHRRERAERQMYVSLAQFPSATLAFVVRTAGGSGAMGTAIRDAIWEIDRDQPISSVEPLSSLMAVVDTGYRVLAKLMVFFAAVALFLATIGIYGVVANLVSQRTREIGIRMTLGADRSRVLRMVVGQGLKLASLGMVVGVPCALAATRSLATLLYQVTPGDPATFLAVPAVFVAVVAAACWIPARRATRVNPVVALRWE
jgi:putative ABC transport system permease protein